MQSQLILRIQQSSTSFAIALFVVMAMMTTDLSSHERDKHNFKCTQCDYNCMAQADLSTHVATQNVKKHDCILCEESFKV